MKRMENAFKVVDNTDAMLAFWDKDLVCRFANASYIKWFGLSPREMINKITLPQLLGPLYEKNLPFISNALKGKLQVFERDIQLPTGEIRNTIATYRPEIENGIVTGFYVHVADVSRLKNPSGNVQESIEDYINIGATETEVRLNAIEQKLRSSLFTGFPGIEALAKEYYISVTKLKQDFKERYESTIFSYYRALQMQIADKYIQEKIYSKAQVASMLGFANPSNFLTCYKKYLSEKIVPESSVKNKEAHSVQNYYTHFITQSSAAMAMFDTELHFLATSQKWMEHFKKLDKNPFGKSLYDVFPNTATLWKEMHANCLKGETLRNEGPITREDGTTAWLHWEMKPWYKSQTEIGGIIIFVESIDHVKENLLGLQQQIRSFEKITDHLHIGTWERNIKTLHITCNNAAKKILELPLNVEPDEVSFFDCFKKGKDRNLIKKCLQEGLTTGMTFDIEANIITSKGNEKRIRVVLFSKTVNNICKRQYGGFQEITVKNNSQKISNKN